MACCLVRWQIAKSMFYQLKYGRSVGDALI